GAAQREGRASEPVPDPRTHVRRQREDADLYPAARLEGGRSRAAAERPAGRLAALGVEAARLGDVLVPVRRVEPVAPHPLARGGCVHELAVADVDADVRVFLAFLVEENEIAAAQLRHLDAMGGRALVVRAARKLATRLRVAPLHQAAAVEAGRGAGASVAIRLADELRGVLRGAIADAAGRALRGRRGARAPRYDEEK